MRYSLAPEISPKYRKSLHDVVWRWILVGRDTLVHHVIARKRAVEMGALEQLGAAQVILFKGHQVREPRRIAATLGTGVASREREPNYGGCNRDAHHHSLGKTRVL